jgi:integrase
VNCGHCGTPLPETSRRDRVYCSSNCCALASYYRRKAGQPTPPRWQHPALSTPDPLLRQAAQHAADLAAANGWSRCVLRHTLDGLSALLQQRPPDTRIVKSEIRGRIPRRSSLPRVQQVLADLDLLEDDTGPRDLPWIERSAATLCPGFAPDVRAWLLTLSQGGPRSTARSQSTLHVYFSSVRPLLERLAEQRDHLREVTAKDITAVLAPLAGWRRRNAIAALRSLFRHAKKHGRIFTDPTRMLRSEETPASVLPLAEHEISAVERTASNLIHRLVIALTAVHATRPAAIRQLTLDDVDLAARRITLAGYEQRLSELAHDALTSWLVERRRRWPHTPNRHVLITAASALGSAPVSAHYLQVHFVRRGVDLERIRADRILHEALTCGPDPLGWELNT